MNWLADLIVILLMADVIAMAIMVFEAWYEIHKRDAW